MNISVTEKDKKMIGILVAFIIAFLFVFMVFSPLSKRNKELDQELLKAKEQASVFDDQVLGAEDMVAQEQATKEQLAGVLARFYQRLQSQDAERMATTLMLNHNLKVQSLTVSMLENPNNVKWYQYSEEGIAEAAMGQPPEEEQVQVFSLYGARVTCVAEGSEADLWALINDLSSNYPSISIASTEWTVAEYQEQQEADRRNTDSQSEEETEQETVKREPVTVKTNRLTISLEIFMCNQ